MASLGQQFPAVKGERGGADARSAAASPLPCLFSNNSNGEGSLPVPFPGPALPVEVPEKHNILTGSHKKSAHCLVMEIANLAKEFGLNRIGFLTLTFADNVQDVKEASKRFNRLNTGVLKRRYSRAVVVLERQKSGRIHYHLVVVCASDIRTGADFGAFERGEYRSANPALRAEWAFWRSTAPKYRFGRTELLPVKSTEEGIARYVGKYVSANIRAREAGDKGARLWRALGFPKGTRKTSSRFAWASETAWIWRRKVAAFAEANCCANTDHLKRVFGPRWAFHCLDAILGQRVEGVEFPSLECAERANEVPNRREVGLSVVVDFLRQHPVSVNPF